MLPGQFSFTRRISEVVAILISDHRMFEATAVSAPPSGSVDVSLRYTVGQMVSLLVIVLSSQVSVAIIMSSPAPSNK